MSTSQTINGLQHYLPATDDAEWGGILSSYLHGLSYAKHGALVFGVSSGITTSTQYMGPGYAAALAAAVSVPMPAAGKLQLGFARCRTTPVGGSVTVDVLKNGNNSMFNGTIAAGDTTASVGLFSTSVAAGDLISVSIIGNSGYSSGGADLIVTIPWVAA